MNTSPPGERADDTQREPLALAKDPNAVLAELGRIAFATVGEDATNVSWPDKRAALLALMRAHGLLSERRQANQMSNKADDGQCLEQLAVVLRRLVARGIDVERLLSGDTPG